MHNDEKPKRRLYETLKSQGLEPGQRVGFLSDGEVRMRRLQLYLSPQSEHILAWFHVTKKLTVMNQIRKGLVGREPGAWLGAVEQDLESLKGHLWNGNVDPALRLVDGLRTILAGDGISSERQKLPRTIREFGNYIAANQAFIPDYGDRHRNGERIGREPIGQLQNGQATADALDRARPHVLLQVRAQVLNGDLRKVCGRWYPGMQARGEQPVRLVA